MAGCSGQGERSFATSIAGKRIGTLLEEEADNVGVTAPSSTVERRGSKGTDGKGGITSVGQEDAHHLDLAQERSKVQRGQSRSRLQVEPSPVGRGRPRGDGERRLGGLGGLGGLG